MKIIAIILLSLLTASIINAGENDLSGAEIIKQLGWLEGKWSGTFEDNPFEAIYSSPKGGVILSISKEFGEKGPCFIEFEKIEYWEDNVFLTPYPGGEKSDKFDLVDYDPEVQKAHFRNPEHDFPTDIIYERTADSLHITAGGKNSAGQLAEFVVRMGLAE